MEDAGATGIDVERASAWLADNVGVEPPVRFELVAGGHSCLTYLVDAADGQRLVLRRPPIGEVLATAHDVAREHRVISALAETDVPVAPTVGLCTDTSIIGASFYVMTFVPGLVLHDTRAARGLTPDARRRAGESMIDVLVALQAVDPDAVGLGDLAKRSDYIGRQLKRWHAQWTSSKTALEKDLAGMERLYTYLVDARPADQGTCVVHGDYRLGNAIHAPDGEVTAMLDWELCTLGDPMADVSYLMRAWVEPDEPARGAVDQPTRAGGFPTRAELLERYARRSGRPVDDLVYWTAFHAWRSACIVAGVYARYRHGLMGAAPDDVHRFERAVDEAMTAGLDAAGLAP